MPKDKGGRPPHEPTDKQRRSAEAMVAIGLTQQEMADLLGVSITTLKKHYEDELKVGKAKMITSLFGKAYKSAMGDGPDARSDRQFILSTKGGFVKTDKHEIAGDIQVSKGPDLSKLNDSQLEALEAIYLGDTDASANSETES